MIKIMFVCHGNICRSPMAEMVMKHLVKSNGISHMFDICSSAVSYEEIGNPVHSGTINTLSSHNIICEPHLAVRLTPTDVQKFDYIIVMDRSNLTGVKRICGKIGDNVFRLLEFTGEDRDISDPWYTGNFEDAFNDVLAGCTAFLDYLRKLGKI